jgi:hypothetical protein
LDEGCLDAMPIEGFGQHRPIIDVRKYVRVGVEVSQSFDDAFATSHRD